MEEVVSVPSDARSLREMVKKIRNKANQEESHIIQSFRKVCAHQVLVEVRGIRGCYMDDGWDPPSPSKRLCVECGLTEESRHSFGGGMKSAVDPVVSDHCFRILGADPRKTIQHEEFKKLQEEFLTVRSGAIS